MTASPPDLEALLVALVLAPATYSRNRFFELYKDPAVRRVRRRASLVRSVVRHLSPLGGPDPGSIIGSTTTPSGRVELTYAVPALGLRRTTTLDPLEAALVRYATARNAERAQSSQEPPHAEEADRQRIEAALKRLSPITAWAPLANDGGSAATNAATPSYPPAEQDPIA